MQTNKSIIQSYTKSYYGSNRNMGIFLFTWGIVALLFGVYAYTQSTIPFWQGIAYPCILLACLQILQAGRMAWQARQYQSDFLATSMQIADVRKEQNQLQKRLAQLSKQLLILQLLFALGLGFALSTVFLHLPELILGSGLTLMIQTAITYIIGVLLRWRTDLYLGELNAIQK